MTQVLQRSLWVLLAFLSACVAGGLALSVLNGVSGFLFLFRNGPLGDASVSHHFLGVIVLGLYSALFFIVFGSVPAIIAALATEYFALRQLRIYLFATLIIFAVFGLVGHLVLPALGSGLIFGLVYWAIAGRNAGSWKLETL